ncbi:7TM diverse intracellular signaling domain-containing protein, partial [Thiolapillus sp.]|uniref:7TM diverse intracellular signaling domain-containing protein n=1 Tax=Thiolapillus sp. TaxID=2017437 RepID=UPI003AF575EB
SIYILLAVLALIWQDGWIGEMLYLPDTVIVNRWLHFFSMLPAVFFYQFYRSFLGLDRKTLGGKLMLGFQFGFVIILVLSQADSYWSDTYMRNLWVMLFNGLLALGALAIFVLTLRYWIMGVKTAGYLFIANLLLIVATLVRIYYAFTFSLENAY